MLSKNDESIAETHKISKSISKSLPCVTLIRNFAIISITPVCCKPPTTPKRPTKNTIVGHSTVAIISSGSAFPWLRNNITAAAAIAIVADCIPKAS